MFRSLSVAAMAVGFSVASQPALACRISVPVHLDDVRYADVVVIGRVINYEIVRDKEFRRKMLSSPTLPADMRKYYRDKDKLLMSDYARFDVLVDEVLAGHAGAKISVATHAIYMDDPARITSAPFVIALRRPGSRIPPLRGPSATVLPDPEAGRLTVLQAPCSGRFIFANTTSEARALREILHAPSR